MERHVQHFRGCWVPAEVFELLRDGAITPRDMVLLSIIDSLLSPTQGCYASNDYLGAQLGCHPRNVQEAIAKLVGMGLLRRYGKPGGRRYLEPTWGRVVPAGGGGDENVTPPAPAITPPDEVRRFRRGGVTKTSPREYKSINTPRQPGVAVRAAGGVSEPEAMEEPMIQGFMPTPATAQRKSSPSPQDTAHATKLLHTLQLKRNVTGRRNITAWANAFRLLRTVDGVSPERLAAVLDWYCAHMTDEYTPRAFTGDEFRQKFLKIEDAMNRGKTTTRPLANVTPAVAAMVAGWGLNWPANTNPADVPPAVAASLEGHRKLTSRLREIATMYRRGSKNYHAIVCEEILHRLGGDETWVTQWWYDTNRTAHTWPQWPGRLNAFIFHLGSKRFTRQVREWVQACYGQADFWDEIKKDIGDL